MRPVRLRRRSTCSTGRKPRDRRPRQTSPRLASNTSTSAGPWRHASRGNTTPWPTPRPTPRAPGRPSAAWKPHPPTSNVPQRRPSGGFGAPSARRPRRRGSKQTPPAPLRRPNAPSGRHSSSDSTRSRPTGGSAWRPHPSSHATATGGTSPSSASGGSRRTPAACRGRRAACCSRGLTEGNGSPGPI
ncbi:MAG: hypothetical protein AMK72_03550 [Planctomycetes bacterium SM23_25]|nr:MAG: hypothetical protein AMK72_03550 [Planctomycetes bacterium SM23_25]